MQEYLKRMYTEKDDLAGKIKRAKKAVANPPFGADAEGMRMLGEQIKGMESYFYWLNERILHEENK